MLKKQSDEELQTLLPFLLNGTLSTQERQAVEAALQREPEQQAQLANLRRIYSAINSRPQAAPSAAARQRLMSQTRRTRQLRYVPRWLPWTSGLVLAAVVLMALWLTLRPGIGLEWSVYDGSVSSFRIYRAPSGSNDFTVVREIPAQPGVQDYSYVDTSLSLNPNYIYRVEGEDSGVAASSPIITASAQAAMRNQLLILAISLIAGLGGVMLSQYLLEIRWSHVLHRTTG